MGVGPRNIQPDLSDKVALVTVRGKGIGKFIALELVAAGANVVVDSRTADELEAVAAEITSTGRQALGRPIDLTQSSQIDELVDTAVKAFGGVHILINNAARSFFRPLMDLREDGFDKVFDTNVKGSFLLSRAAAWRS